MDSVYGLMSSLCEALYSGKAGTADRKAIKASRKRAFEILFETGNVSANGHQIPKIMEDFRIHAFEMKLKADTVRKSFKIGQMEAVVAKIEASELDETTMNVLELLFQLRETSPDETEPQPPFLTPLPDVPIDGRYPLLPDKIFAPGASMEQMQVSNPYVLKSSDSESAFTNIFNTRLDSLSLKNDPPSERYFSLQSSQGYNTFTSNFTRSYRKAGDEAITEAPQRRSSRRGSRRSRLLNWENLGSRQGTREPSFATECNSLLALLCIQSKHVNEEFAANVISMEAFLLDLKYLTVGISSESFHFNKDLSFSMVPHLTVQGVAPSTFKGTVAEFIEMGTCFKRLQLMMMRKDPKTFDLIYDGFIFKALCESVEIFLITIRKLVLSFPDESILGFSRRIGTVRKQITTLSKILCIHPTSDSSKKMTVGSDFLGALYRAIIPITHSDVALFLMFILKNCFQVYFSCFEKWLFQGFLVDQYSELFIVFEKGYKEKTKAHFDKAYQIQKQSVPLFLQGWEEDILLCGKYTMLLKQYNSTHPVFTMDRIALRVCLTFGELDELKKKCIDYSKKARELCGEPVTVAAIFTEKHRKSMELQEKVAENARLAFERGLVEQEAKAAETLKMRAQQREELKLQIEELREMKLAEKKANIQRELMYLKEAQKVEDERLMAENLERIKRIEYYEELNRLIDEKHERTEKLTAKLRNELRTSPDGVMAMSIGSDNFSPEDDKSTHSASIPSIPEAVTKENLKNSHRILQKSESDILNANHIDSEFEKNRKKAMTSTLLDQLNLDTSVGTSLGISKEGRRNRDRVMAEEYNLRDQENNDEELGISLEDVVLLPKMPLTAAERNRLKVLGSTFLEEARGLPLKDPRPQTDLQRNREKIMTAEFHLLEEPEKEEDNRKSPVGELTDLQRNRKKIMSQEFNLLEEEEPKAPRRSLNLNTDRAKNRKRILESEFNIITSDTPSPDFEHLPVLKVDTHIANDETIPERFGIPNTSVLEQPTPESAIDGGLACTSATDGFIFSPKKSGKSEEKSAPKSESPSATRDEFIRIIERKMNSLMPLYMPSPTKERKSPPPAELKSLDATTLTKFLQSSIVLPLTAHMEIVNGEILKLFLLDLDVIGHFKSLRNYFFMMDIEFGSYVCEGLLKWVESGVQPKEFLSFQTLHTLLDNAVRSSIHEDDKNTEKLSFKVTEVPEKFDLWSPDALNMLTLQYQVSWPLNLILNQETLQQYSHIFKHLLKVRRLKWVLESSFQVLKETVKKQGTSVLGAHHYRKIQEIRHKLTQFICALLNHITRSALQVSWKKFMDDLQGTSNMEQIYRKHVAYIKRILFLLMLKDRCRPFKQCLDEIFVTILQFYRNLVSHEFVEEEGTFKHPQFEEMNKIERHFETKVEYLLYLGNKMVDSGFQYEISEFINLINMNGFYAPTKRSSPPRNK